MSVYQNDPFISNFLNTALVVLSVIHQNRARQDRPTLNEHMPISHSAASGTVLPLIGSSYSPGKDAGAQ